MDDLPLVDMTCDMNVETETGFGARTTRSIYLHNQSLNSTQHFVFVVDNAHHACPNRRRNFHRHRRPC